jgi:hypothetical protein
MENALDTFIRFWSDFSAWNPPNLTLYTIVSFGLLSAWMMTRIVAAAPLFAGPVSFIILTSAAMISNFSFREVGMMGTSEIQKALIFTVLGHAVAGVLLLAIFKVSQKGVKK